MADGKTATPWLISLTLAALAGAGLAAIAAPPPNRAAESARLAGPYLAAQSAQATGDWMSAADFAALALEADPHDPTLSRYGLLLMLARGDLAEATRLAAALPSDAPESPLLPLLRAVEAVSEADGAAAEEALRALPDQGFQRAVRRALLAEILFARGLSTEADELLTGLRERGGDPGLAAARRVSLALEGTAAADLIGVVGDFLAADPGAALRLAVAQRLRRGGAFEAAAAVAEDSLARYGEGALFAEEAALARDRIRAVPVVRRNEARFAEALLDLARQADRRGSAAMTLVLARLAQRLSPGDAEAAILIGAVFERFGQAARARGFYESVSPASDQALQAGLRAAIAAETEGQRAAAIARLETLSRRHPQSIAAPAALGEMHRSAGDTQAAQAAFEQTAARARALGLSPSWQLHFALALSHFENGRWDQAADPLAAALQARPQEAQARALAALVTLKGGDVESAEAHAFAALESGPDSPAALRAYAEVMLARGRLQAAVEALEAATVAAPTAADLNEALGDAYWRIGRRSEAQFQWRRAAASVSDRQRLAKLNRKLQVGLEAGASPADAPTRLSTASP